MLTQLPVWQDVAGVTFQQQGCACQEAPTARTLQAWISSVLCCGLHRHRLAQQSQVRTLQKQYRLLR